MTDPAAHEGPDTSSGAPESRPGAAEPRRGAPLRPDAPPASPGPSPLRYPVPPPEPPPPPGFVAHRYETQWEVPLPRQAVWDWLNDTRTFTEGQPWPYFVEFVDGGFETGVLNTHTGPGIHFCGVIGEVREREYRDLVYLYGAHTFSMRWIRPTRLQFWLEEIRDGDGTRLRMRLDSHCRAWIRGLWTFGNKTFWRMFGPTIRGGAFRYLK